MTVMRARYDNYRDAGRWRAIVLGAVPDPREDRSVSWDPGFLSFLDRHDEAKEGDVWVFRLKPAGPHVTATWRAVDAETAHWPVSHYGLVCPAKNCRYGVHVWDHAYNCPAREVWGADCKRGGKRLSCWDWTGTIEAHTLTADPSLHILPVKDKSDQPYPADDLRQTCQWHGWLKKGAMTQA